MGRVGEYPNNYTLRLGRFLGYLLSSSVLAENVTEVIIHFVKYSYGTFKSIHICHLFGLAMDTDTCINSVSGQLSCY